MSSLAGQASGTQLGHPFGALPNQLAGSLQQTEIGPLLHYLGFGPQAGSAAAGRQASQLAGATGPLASLINQIRGFAPGVEGQAQTVGSNVAARGSQAFTSLTDQINQGLQANTANLGYARAYEKQAFDPTSDTPLFQEASQRLLDQIRPGLAARGIESAGAGQAAETSAIRDLTLGFDQQKQQNQLAALSAVPAAASAGPGLAAGGLSAVPQYGATQEAAYQQPLQALSSILNLLTAGQQPGLALAGLTAPQYTPYGVSGFGSIGSKGGIR